MRSLCEVNDNQNAVLVHNRAARLVGIYARILRIPAHRQREILLTWAYRSAIAMEQRVQASFTTHFLFLLYWVPATECDHGP